MELHEQLAENCPISLLANHVELQPHRQNPHPSRFVAQNALRRVACADFLRV
jgi:hypothetical protein